MNYQIVTGPASAPKVECLAPMNQTPWVARFCYGTPDEDGMTTYAVAEYNHRPTVADVRQAVNSYYGDMVAQRILTGFVYDGLSVWLSEVNQLNYTAAMLTKAASLTIKGGTDEEPVYRTLTNEEEISQFVTAMREYIAACIAEGWKLRDNFDYAPYE